jgi:hypothetical protein
MFPARFARASRLAIIVWGVLLLGLSTALALPPKAKDEFQRQMKGKSVEIRAAAVHALKDHADPETARLIFLLALGDEAPEVRQAGRQTLLSFKESQPIGQRLLDDARAELLQGAKGQAVAASEAIQVLCEFEPPAIHTGLMNLLKRRESGSPLPQLLKSRPTPQTAVPAADALMLSIDRWGTARDAAKVPRLERFAKSEHFAENYGFRKSIVDAAIAMHDPAAVSLLIDTLPQNTGRTRSTALVYLGRATGQQIGNDDKQWKSWWQANRESTKLANVGDLTIPDKNGSYYEIPIQWQRVVFVIDTSDSMRAGEGVTRMDAAKKALIQTLNGLSGNVEFNVVAFHDGVTLWKRSGLLPANAKNKADAIAFVQKWAALGKTATYDGLMAAFDCDPNVEAIFCVSDGDPSTGKIVEPAQILAEVRQLNRMRRVNIHAIGVFGGQQYESLATFMKTLAEQNAGEFKRVD